MFSIFIYKQGHTSIITRQFCLIRSMTAREKQAMKTLTLILVIICTTSRVWATPQIDPNLQNLAVGETANIMVTISNRTDAILSRITSQLFASRSDQVNAVHNALLAHATLNQIEALAALAVFGRTISIISYWVSNQIFIKGATSLVIQTLSLLPSVSKIEAEFFIPLESIIAEAGQTKQSGTNTYGVTKIQAPAVWALGYTGQRILVANIDTGVRPTHQALTGRFLGRYGWYDPYMFTRSPNDQGGHGTHTMGTMTGTGGIGVAPGATWAACKGCTAITCSSNALTACGQFFTCPSSGTLFPTKDCSKAPHVINNSWGGSGNSSWYNDIIKAWNAAGIVGVFSAGNSGSNGCGSIGSPADQNQTIAVGATDDADTLASYSSLGPASNGLLKPDIVAPGSNVISSYHISNTAYQTMSGTSMAAPHVAGTVALLLSKNNELKYADIYTALTQNCDQATLIGRGLNCGSRSESMFPNNAFGWGRVNALRSINFV